MGGPEGQTTSRRKKSGEELAEAQKGREGQRREDGVIGDDR